MHGAVFPDYERIWNLRPGSVISTLSNPKLLPTYNALQRGEMLVPEFETIFARLYAEIEVRQSFAPRCLHVLTRTMQSDSHMRTLRTYTFVYVAK